MTWAEGAKCRTKKRVAIGNSCTEFVGNQIKVHLTVLIPVLFGEPIKTGKEVF